MIGRFKGWHENERFDEYWHAYETGERKLYGMLLYHDHQKDSMEPQDYLHKIFVMLMKLYEAHSSKMRKYKKQ